jgi:prepilin-type N-terminal cleavage/methylation domain-containing protein
MPTSIKQSGRKPGARLGAFTLIEVLVVVAIIALLISILLPSLRQARDLAKLTVCLTNQKNIGNGMQMYWSDNKDYMPGPIHPMFLAHPEEMVTGPVDTENKKFIVQGYINTRLRKYMGDSKFGKGQNMKAVGIDPAFPISDSEFEATKPTPIPVYHYAINSSDLTAPWLYFGFTHAGIGSDKAWDTTYGGMVNGVITDIAKRNHYSPKKLGKIFSGTGPGGSSWRFSPGTEWLIADAFRRPLRAKQAGNWPDVDEPGNESFSDLPSPVWKENRQWGSLSNHVHGSGDAASAKVAPFHPYHYGGGFKKNPNGETVFKGKVATLYFDLHAVAQDEWRGTVFERRMLGNDPTMRD